MKRITLLFIIAFVGKIFIANAQLIDLKDFKKGKMDGRKFVFSIPPLSEKEASEYPEYQVEFENLVKKYWTINDNFVVLPYDDAREMVLKNKETTVLAQFITKAYYTSYNEMYAARNVGSPGNEFRLVIPKGVLNVARKSMIIFVEDDLSTSDVVYSLMACQYYLKNYSKYTSKNTLKESCELNGNLLRDKTLIISEGELEKVTEEEIRESYPFSFKIVSNGEKEEAILAQNEDYLFINYGKEATTNGAGEPIKVIYSSKTGAIASWSISKLSFGALGSRLFLKEQDFKVFVKNAKIKKDKFSMK